MHGMADGFRLGRMRKAQNSLDQEKRKLEEMLSRAIGDATLIIRQVDPTHSQSIGDIVKMREQLPIVQAQFLTTLDACKAGVDFIQRQSGKFGSYEDASWLDFDIRAASQLSQLTSIEERTKIHMQWTEYLSSLERLKTIENQIKYADKENQNSFVQLSYARRLRQNCEQQLNYLPSFFNQINLLMQAQKMSEVDQLLDKQFNDNVIRGMLSESKEAGNQLGISE